MKIAIALDGTWSDKDFARRLDDKIGEGCALSR